jgi:hypothetical protein
MLMLHRKACNFFRLGVYTSPEMRDIYSETETNAAIATAAERQFNSNTPSNRGIFTAFTVEKCRYGILR